MKLPKVSIIMPAYNCANLISFSIESVLNQSFKAWELIIVNDCSTDNTLSVIESFISKDERIKVISNNVNQGVAQSRNIGIQKASNEWIAFLDSDDLWTQEKLKEQLEFNFKHTAEFSFTGSSYIDMNNKYFKGQLIIPKIITYQDLKKQNVISCSSVMIKKEYMLEFPMEDDSLHEDYLTWLRIIKKTNVAYGLNNPYLIYRISTNSKSGNKLKTIKMTFKVFKKMNYSVLESLYYTLNHSIRAALKYKRILKG